MMNNKSVFFLSVIVLTGIAIILLNTKITPKFEFIEKPKEEIKYLEGDQLTNLVYGAVPIAMGLEKTFSVQVTLLVWILGLLILYPVCIQFKRFKKKYPQSFLKYF